MCDSYCTRVYVCILYVYVYIMCVCVRVLHTYLSRRSYVRRSFLAREMSTSLCRRSRETLIAGWRERPVRIALRPSVTHTGKGDFGTYIINNRVTRRHDATSYGGSFAATARRDAYILDEPAYVGIVMCDSP